MPISVPSVGDPTKQTLAQALADALAALEVDVAAIVGERLVTNGSFEVDSDSDGFPDQWTCTPYTGGTFSLVSDTGTGANSAHGLKAIKFTHPGGGGNGGGEIVTHADTFIEISPERPYVLTWMNKNSVAGVTNSVEILEYDATQTLLATQVIFSETSNPTAWTMFKVKFKVSDPLTRYAKIKFKCGETSASTAGDIFIDNVQLQFAHFENRYVIDKAGSGTWNAPSFVRAVEIECIGAGGGGGGNNGGGSNGGGGGGGGYARALIACTPGTSYSYTVGLGGSGGPTTSAGSAGTASTITIGSTTLTANGGNGGQGDGGAGTGGSGGSATGGDDNFTGGAGGNAGGAIGGVGGIVTPIGFSCAGSTTTTPGIDGQFAGCGGGGAVQAAGGSGHDGALIIRW